MRKEEPPKLRCLNHASFQKAQIREPGESLLLLDGSNALRSGGFFFFLLVKILIFDFILKLYKVLKIIERQCFGLERKKRNERRKLKN